MPTGATLTLAAYCAALLATLVLAAWLTPRAWWRRANARALAVLVAGTFGIGSLLLWLAGKPAAAQPLLAGHSYRVYADLNLREASGVASRRLAVVPAGAAVTATGVHEGDWWQVSARIDGRDVQGWASSLWLRRPAESRQRYED